MIALALLLQLTSREEAAFLEAAAEFLRQEDSRQRDRIYGRRLARFERERIEDLRAALRRGLPVPRESPGFHHGRMFRSHDEEWTYTVRIPDGYDPSRRYPLVLDPGHQTIRAPEAVEDVMSTWLLAAGVSGVIYVRSDILNRLGQTGRYDAWSRPHQQEAGPSPDTIAAIYLDLLRHLIFTYAVDPDRVVVHGISQTGFWAWYLGMSRPDRFSAILPVSSVTWQVSRGWEAFGTLPVFILQGSQDTVVPPEQARNAARALRELGAPVEYLEIEGGEHIRGTFPRLRDLAPRALGARREAYPTRLGKPLYSAESPWCYWVRAEPDPGAYRSAAPLGRLRAERDGGTIRIEAEGVRRLAIALAPEMAPEGEATITLNGREIHRGRLRPRLRTMLDVAYEKGDCSGTFVALVEIEP